MAGRIKRVIDINKPSLSIYTLSSSLKEVSDQEKSSVFAGNKLCYISPTENTVIENEEFVNARFEAYSGKEFSLIINKKTGEPLHLEGIGHKNELASSWVTYTLDNSFFLGKNRMVGVKTISEDLKENQLLFSIKKLTSWLPFYDTYLPIFKQIIEIEDSVSETWDYHLYELRESLREKEYVAVEKKFPYRILADKKSNQFFPRIVKSRTKSIRSPEELSTIQKFFLAEKGILTDIE